MSLILVFRFIPTSINCIIGHGDFVAYVALSCFQLYELLVSTYLNYFQELTLLGGGPGPPLHRHQR